MKRPLTSLALLLALFAVPAWAQTGERADVLRLSSAAANQINAADPHPDEAFFSVKGAPPSLVFIVDSSGSMMSLVVSSYGRSRNTTNGSCSDSTYDAVISAGGFTMSGNYPPPDLGVASFDPGFPDLFKQDRFYVNSSSGNDAVDGMQSYSTVNSSYVYSSANSICDTFRSSQRSNCRSCLASKGYFLGHNSSGSKREAFSGKFLNFYPPKFVTARTVVKNAIWNTERVRIGLAEFDGNNGAKILSKLAPQCTASLNPDSNQWEQGRKALIEKVNAIPFDGNTPLAESLFDVASSFVQDDQLASWFGASHNRRNNSLKPAAVDSEDRPICFGCQVSAIILISDGEPTQDGSVPQAIKDMNVTCSGTGCSDQYLDDVAAFFYQRDVQPDLPAGSPWDASGPQRIATYTIGFGISLPLMESAAAAGGGTYQEANDGTSLATAITTIVNDINKRSTTAGSTSIASLQAGSETTTLIPRFRPGSDVDPWRGFLYRFGLANELTNGCVATGDPGNPGENDVDRDGYCNSIAYVDRDGYVVVEDPVSGDFVRAIDGNPARPYWEAGTQLVQSGQAVHDNTRPPDTTAAQRRNLWTAVASDGEGIEPVRFHPDNAAQLMHAMGLQNDVRGEPTCRQIATSMGITSDLESLLSNWGQECAKIIIRHYRGESATHQDPDKRNKPREWLLADIFHSSPIVVEPPVKPESCANFPSQCVASLWVEEGSFAAPAPREAYTNFVEGPYCGSPSCEERRVIALVGSNGGFLHAFDMGVPDPDGTRDLLTGRLPLADHGTGTELWGFMPPDILGTLKDGMRSHTFMVDGTAMVREVWVDGSSGGAPDGKKQAEEFRTVAVVGTGSGGSHFFGLDLTASLNLPASHESLVTQGPQPKVRWMWPEANSPRVADMGQTFSNFYPRPPPIGPVLLQADGDASFEFRFQDVSDSGEYAEQTVQAQERWIVGLNGGVDPTLQRGRGFALVDVWTGQTVWEQFWAPDASDARKDMLHPIPAGLALMDIGSGQLTSEPPFDGYFDTLTVGDMGGNLWVARMHHPGRIGEGGMVENWHVARGFQTERDASDARARRPITNLTSNALQRTTGYMRTFFGTGDRGSLLDPTTGKCSLSNLQACVAMGCNVQVDEWRDRLPLSTHRRTYWNGGAITSAAETVSNACVAADCAQPKIQACVNACSETSCGAGSGFSHAAGRAACIALARESCGSPCDGTPRNNMGLMTLVSVTQCSPEPGHTPMVRAIDSSCGEREVTIMVPDPDGGEDATMPHTYTTRSCGSTVLRNDAAFEVAYLASDSGANVKHRFIGAHVYGGNAERAFANAAGAAAFDADRRTESELTSLGTRGGDTTTEADPLGPGWYLDYEQVNERTASPAGMAASLTGDSLCVVWNSLVPGEEEAEVCGGAGEQQAYLIQADFATGGASCLQDFTPGQRAVARSVISAPPEPTPATVIGAGSVASGFMTTEPGQSPRFIRGFTNADPLQPIYQLELTNQEHQCRHTAEAAACGI
ncbi:MAG TPA: hypothetical protein VK013_07505 [Myxococcaceae bacterium]|nr:hypothetical protein [Myxococcaceae bacterium]